MFNYNLLIYCKLKIQLPSLPLWLPFGLLILFVEKPRNSRKIVRVQTIEKL